MQKYQKYIACQDRNTLIKQSASHTIEGNHVIDLAGDHIAIAMKCI